MPKTLHRDEILEAINCPTCTADRNVCPDCERLEGICFGCDPRTIARWEDE